MLDRAIELAATKPKSHWTPLIAPFCLSVLADELSNFYRFDSWVFWVLSLAASTILAVTTHRLILLGSNYVPKYGLKFWGRRETHFFAYMTIIELAIFAAAMVPVLILLFVSISFDALNTATFWVLFTLGTVVSVYISSRFCLVLPATAIDRPLFMSGAWNQSRKHQKTVFLIFGIIPLSLSAPGIVLYFFDSTVIAILVDFLVSVGIVVGIMLLSITYEEIAKIPDE